MGRWDNPSHPIFDFDSSVHPGLDIRESAFKTNVSEWWNSPDKDLKQWDRKESTVKPWQVCEEFFVSTYYHFQLFDAHYP